MGDEEVVGSDDAGFDLDANRILAVALGQHVETRVVERLLDRGPGRAHARRRARRSTPRRWTSLVSTARTCASAGISVSTAARGSTKAAVTTRGGFACISSWRSSSARRAVCRPSRSAALKHQTRVTLAWVSCRPALRSWATIASSTSRLLSSSSRCSTRSRTRCSSAPRRTLTWAQKRWELVGDDPARRVLLGLSQPPKSAGGDDIRRDRRRNTVQVRSGASGLHRGVLVDVCVAEAARDGRVGRVDDFLDDPDEQARFLKVWGRRGRCRGRASSASGATVSSVTASCSGCPGASSSARASVSVEHVLDVERYAVIARGDRAASGRA